MLDEGIDACRKAVRLGPRDAGFWNNLGVILEERSEAESDAAKAIAMREEAAAARREAELLGEPPMQAEARQGEA
jgi:Flp pilus assembly protein TadD